MPKGKKRKSTPIIRPSSRSPSRPRREPPRVPPSPPPQPVLVQPPVHPIVPVRLGPLRALDPVPMVRPARARPAGEPIPSPPSIPPPRPARREPSPSPFVAPINFPKHTWEIPYLRSKSAKVNWARAATHSSVNAEAKKWGVKIPYHPNDLAANRAGKLFKKLRAKSDDYIQGRRAYILDQEDQELRNRTAEEALAASRKGGRDRHTHGRAAPTSSRGALSEIVRAQPPEVHESHVHAPTSGRRSTIPPAPIAQRPDRAAITQTRVQLALEAAERRTLAHQAAKRQKEESRRRSMARATPERIAREEETYGGVESQYGGVSESEGGIRQMIFLAAKGAPAQAEVGQAAAQPLLPHQTTAPTWKFASPSLPQHEST